MLLATISLYTSFPRRRTLQRCAGAGKKLPIRPTRGAERRKNERASRARVASALRSICAVCEPLQSVKVRKCQFHCPSDQNQNGRAAIFPARASRAGSNGNG